MPSHNGGATCGHLGRAIEQLHAESIKQMKRQDLRLRPGIVVRHAREGVLKAAIISLAKQARCRVTMPAVGMGQQLDQLRGFQRPERGGRPGLVSFGNNPPDAALVETRRRIDLTEDLRRQKRRPLDQLATHVDDIQTTIRRVGHLGRAKPDILGGEELLIFIGSLRLVANALLFQPGPEQQIVGNLTDEYVAFEFGGKRVAAINRDSRRTSEEPRGSSPFVVSGHDSALAKFGADFSPRFGFADAVQFRELAARQNVESRRRGNHGRVSRQKTGIVHEHLDRVAVAANENVPPIIHRHAVLAAAAGEFKLVGPWIEQDVEVARRHRLDVRPAGHADLAAVHSGGNQKALLGGPAEGVEMSLAGLVPAEAGQDHFAGVGFAVAVGVLHVDQVRRDADIDATVPTGQSGGIVQVIGKDRPLVVPAVAIGVGQHDNPPAALGPRGGVGVVFGEFDDPKPAVLVELHAHGGLNERLGGNQFGAKARAENKRLAFLLRRLWRNPQHGGVDFRCLGGSARGENRQDQQQPATNSRAEHHGVSLIGPVQDTASISGWETKKRGARPRVFPNHSCSRTIRQPFRPCGSSRSERRRRSAGRPR